jgi:alpha-tubulin suppressor-like RCC1 family protein
LLSCSDNHIDITLFLFIQVEALLSYRVMDIACGSGDAQTLCITDDDNVWSWGDGDYGKLGRGGSDGCKVSIFHF